MVIMAEQELGHMIFHSREVLALDEGGTVSTVLEFGAAVFSLVLLSVTLYAWFKRGRQPTLLIVSFAFLTFFVRQALEVLPFGILHTELASSILDFLTLTLFFIGLVVAPRRRERSAIGVENADNIKS